MNDNFNKYIACQNKKVKSIDKEKCIKDILCNYNGLRFLKNGIPPRSDKIYLCIYRINIKEQPFLEFCLKDHENFYFIILEKNDDFLEKCKDFLGTIFETTFEAENREKVYKGYILYNGDPYFFIDASFFKPRKTEHKEYKEYKGYEGYKEIEYFLVEEIMNNFLIKNTINFFLSNKNILYLFDKKGEKIETPSVAYIGCEEYKLGFLYTMGPLRFNYNYIPCPFYCFTDYKGSLVSNEYMMEKKEEKTERKGIIKFALFLGNIKIISDPNYNIIDDKWMNSFDSVYISKGNKYLPNSPIWIVKNKKQFVSLSIMYQE